MGNLSLDDSLRSLKTHSILYSSVKIEICMSGVLLQGKIYMYSNVKLKCVYWLCLLFLTLAPSAR